MNTNVAQLNEEQVKAVNKIDGPVMVIAGPGTGKTQILASRIAKILETTDSQASNILCLTYTDAGTVAMKRRLIQYIGNDAHRVSVHTFHSFCHRVIQENQEEFEYRNLQPVSDLDRLQIINKIAIELEEDHPLKKMKGNVGYLIPRLVKLFAWMKKENYQNDQIVSLCEQHKKDIRNSEEYRYKVNRGDAVKGDLNMNRIGKIDTQLEDLIGGANLFQRYNTLMKKAGFYDYDDMILWVIDLFSRARAVLSSYQELFHYILVDEFQDTNGSQNKIIEQLTSYWENPNIFVVGDDDQSIYRFQGAEVKNVADFVDRHKSHLYPVLLNQNYRSTQVILDASKVLIDENKGRLVNIIDNLDKHLLSNSAIVDETAVKVVSFSSEFHEAFWLSSEIDKAIKSGIDPEQIAVIYRKHRHAEFLAELMANRGQEVFFRKAENALHNPEVLKILTFLKYVSTETSYPYSGEVFLFEMMHLSPFDLKPITNARVAHYVYSKRLRWREFYTNLDSLDLLSLDFDVDEINSLKSFGNFIEDLLLQVHQLPLHGYLDYLIKSMRISEKNVFDTYTLECIHSLMDFTQSECYAKPSTGLSDLLEKIQLMEDQYIGLSKERLLYDRKGVQFMTAHGSKGLEFQYVFIINCSEKAWDKDTINQRPYGFINLFQTDDASASEEENRRLFYVAMTRAKEKLVMTHHLFDNSRKDITRSSFLDQIIQAKMVEEIEGTTDPEQGEILLNQITYNPRLKTSDLLDKHVIDTYLQNYQLSPSHLNAYLQCSTSFYFEQILRVPSAKNKYMSFGTAVHRSLDQLFKIKSTEASKFTSAQLRENYEKNIGRERHVFTTKEFEDFLSLGLNILTGYFDERSNYWLSRNDLRSEVTIDRVEIEGVPIKGQLDLLDVDRYSVQVLDFKTGDASNSAPRLKPPIEGANAEDGIDSLHGGPYWRQMMFYALLIKKNTIQPMTMLSGTFEFVEPDKNGKFQSKKIVVDPEGLKHMESLIADVYSRIQKHDFIEGCQLDTCRWCSFVAKNGNKFEDERLPL
jgi:ATP-dependent DNA helicase UvrD/PcrA